MSFLTPRAAVLAAEGVPPATDQALGYVGVNPGTVRDFDIRGGRVEEPLPFDVQFFIQSPIEPDVRSVSGRYVQFRGQLPDGQNCDALFPVTVNEPRGYMAPLLLVSKAGNDVAMLASGSDRPPVRADTPVPGQRPISFVRFIEPAQTAGQDAPVTAGRKVELSVPEVGPNRGICFEFDLERQVNVDQFRQLARRAVDAELRSSRWVRPVTSATGETKRSTIQTPAAFNRLRRHLIGDILRQAKRGERLSAPAGSFFDPHLNLAGVTSDYTRRFVEIMGSQTNRFEIIAGIDGSTSRFGTRDELVVSLRKLLTSDAYRALKASGTLAKRLLGDTIIPGLTQDNYGQWAEGRGAASTAAAGTSLNLESLWQPETLAATTAGDIVTPGILDNLEQGQRDFAALARVVEQFKNEPDLARMDGLGDGQVEELEAAVKEVQTKLFFHVKALQQLDGLLTTRQQSIEELVDQLALELVTRVRLLGTSVADYETRASFYISADVGAGFAPDVEEAFTYFGTNIYLRPVNKKAPLRGLAFKKRFSFIVGLTSEDLESEGQLKGIIGKSPLLFGGGLRLNEFLRLSVGAVVFKDEDPNPLITNESLAWTPYVSLSIDWNLRKVFSRFGGALNLTDVPIAAAP